LIYFQEKYILKNRLIMFSKTLNVTQLIKPLNKISKAVLLGSSTANWTILFSAIYFCQICYFQKEKKIQQFPVKHGISGACSKLLLVSHGQQWSNNLSKTRKKKQKRVKRHLTRDCKLAWMIQCFSLSSGITAATAQSSPVLFYFLFCLFFMF